MRRKLVGLMVMSALIFGLVGVAQAVIIKGGTVWRIVETLTGSRTVVETSCIGGQQRVGYWLDTWDTWEKFQQYQDVAPDGRVLKTWYESTGETQTEYSTQKTGTGYQSCN